MASASGGGGDPIRVLLVDDHALVRAGIRSLLGGMSQVVVVAEAASGEEALALTESARPDVVLMDIAMKGLTGLEAAARIRDRHPTVRVVILSAGLVFAKGASLGNFELLAPAVYVLAGLTVFTTIQRIVHVRGQLKAATAEA